MVGLKKTPAVGANNQFLEVNRKNGEVTLTILKTKLSWREKRLKDYAFAWSTNKFQTAHQYFFSSMGILEEAFRILGLKTVDYPVYKC